MTRRGFFGFLAAAAPRERIVRSRDRRTGRVVWQITAGSAISHSCYFEAQPFTGDDRFLTYCSNRSGAFQLYAVDLRTEETRLLTHCGKLSGMSFSMHPNGADVYYLDGSSLCKTEVASGKTSVVVELAQAFPAARGSKTAVFSAGRCFSAGGEYLPAACSEEGKNGAMGLVDTRTGRVEKRIVMPAGTGGHMLICPADPCMVTFVRKPDEQNDMTLPMERRARSMMADLRTGRIRPYLTMPYGSRATHEYWAPDGERFYFHRKTVPGWCPASICSMRRDGGDWRTHFRSETLKLGHSMISPDGRLIVSDVQMPNQNPLVLVDLRTGGHEVLCWPDSSSAESQLTHVHPAFSRSGKYVAYTSDCTGVPQVYVVPLAGRGAVAVVAEPRLLGGQLAIRGARLSVSLIFRCLANGMSLEDIDQAFDHAFPHEALPEVLKAASELAVRHGIRPLRQERR